MIPPRLLTVLLMVIGFVLPGAAQIDLCEKKQDPIVVKHFEFAIQPTQSDELPLNSEFEVYEGGAYDLGIEDITHWIRFDIENACLDDQHVLRLENPIVDDVMFRIVREGREIDQFIFSEGTNQVKKYELPDSFTIPIKKEYGYAFTVYARVNSVEHIRLSFTSASVDQVQGIGNRYHLFLGLYLGIVLIMIAYNLFIWFSVGDRVYLSYAAFMLTVCITQVTFLGFTQAYVWSDSQFWLDKGLYIFGSLTNVTTAIFVQQFLHTKKESRVFHFGLYFIIAVGLAALLASLAGYNRLSYNLIDFNAVVGSLIVLVGSVTLAIRGSRSARFFLMGWSFFLSSTIIFVLKDFGVLSANALTKYSLIIGSMLEAIMLSLALADRINILKKENAEKEREKLKALEEKRLLTVKQNEILERKVAERTHELEKSNHELDDALHTLQDAQSQLIESEKMASLGQLTASIAHELNNPINFVSSNVEPLRMDLEEIFSIVDKTAGEDPKTKGELEMLKDEANDLLRGIHDGATRTSDIVKGLRIFSRMDEKAFQTADINECLRSTIVILKTSIKGVCQFEVEYGELPEIRCNPGKMTQVFTNLITNASQALESTGKPVDECIIHAKTVFEGSGVVVSIKDNGPGISPAELTKIFEPFYTTKRIGEGTGLGLSIAKGIVDDHKGTITVHSTLGEGSEFVIRLPFIQ